MVGGAITSGMILAVMIPHQGDGLDKECNEDEEKDGQYGRT